MSNALLFAVHFFCINRFKRFFWQISESSPKFCCRPRKSVAKVYRRVVRPRGGTEQPQQSNYVSGTIWFHAGVICCVNSTPPKCGSVALPQKMAKWLRNILSVKRRMWWIFVVGPRFSWWKAALGNVGSKLNDSRKMARLTILNQTDNWQ